MSTGPLIVHDLPDLPRTHGIEWGEAYFTGPEDFRTWFSRHDIATRKPVWIDKVFPVSSCILTAHIQPEAWSNDITGEVAPEGEAEWRLIPADLDIRSSDLDFLTRSANAPQWVRDWSGPFTIYLEIDFPEYPSAHAQLALRYALGL